jgi:hypothetical protein
MQIESDWWLLFVENETGCWMENNQSIMKLIFHRDEE